MTPRPIGDRILVRQDPPKDMIGSLYIPDVAGKDYPNTGEVVAIGAGALKSLDSQVQVGDRVMFKRRPGSSLIPDDREPGAREDNWKDLVMLRAEDVLAVVD